MGLGNLIKNMWKYNSLDEGLKAFANKGESAISDKFLKDTAGEGFEYAGGGFGNALHVRAIQLRQLVDIRIVIERVESQQQRTAIDRRLSILLALAGPEVERHVEGNLDAVAASPCAIQHQISPGAGRLSRCGRYAWAGLWLALLAAVALEAPLAIIARQIFAAYGHPMPIQNLEVMYFRYMVLAGFLTLPSRVLESFFYGIHRSSIVYAASIASFVVNIVAIYPLIFGKWGFPRLGLEGAAIGSLIAWTVQLAILAAFFGPLRIRKLL